MKNCFEKHTVNLDPSSSRTQTSTVYRPIDRYMNVLPHLIGSDKWNERWHVGLLDVETESQAGSERYAESVDSNHSRNVNQPLMETESISSQKSTSSIGDQMIINEPAGLFDEIEDERLPYAIPTVPVVSIFRPQEDQRKIVNLFDDEPPSLDSSPAASRKPYPLFDDYGSTASLATPPSEKISIQPPVDLFNDNEFDDYIRKIEKQDEKVEVKAAEVTATSDVRQDVMNELIAKTQTNKMAIKPSITSIVTQDNVKVLPDVKKIKIVEPKRPEVKAAPSKPTNVTKEPPKVVIKEPPPADTKPKRIKNLFDDDDDEDYFAEIMKQKSSKAPSQPFVSAKIPEKAKAISLFDDDDDGDDEFDNVFSKKPPTVDAIKKVTKSSLFDDEESSVEVDERKVVGSESKVVVKEPKVDKNKLKVKENEKVVANALKAVVNNPEVVENIPKVIANESKVVESKPAISGSSSNLFDERVEPSVLGLNPKVPSEISEPSQAPKTDFPSEIETSEPIRTSEGDMGNKSSQQRETPPRIESRNQPTVKVNERESEKTEKQSFLEPQPAKLPTEVPKIIEFDSSKILNTTLPFLDDEPPDDDDLWDAEENYDEAESKPTSRNVLPIPSIYSSVPLFDDVPPDDDDFPIMKTPEPEVDFNSSDGEAAPPTVSRASALPEDEKNLQKSELEAETFVYDPEVLPTAGNIKNKLDIFTKKIDGTSPPSEASKKPLPGKLKGNLQINVSALVPGARLPSMRNSEERTFDDSTPVPPVTQKIDTNNNNSNLLNNDLTKHRAKIQVKRRPSTKRGRAANLQRTQTDDDIPEDKDEIKSLPATIQTQPSNVASAPSTKRSMFDDQPPPLEPLFEAVKTNKISVFYDDEDDTRKMLEQRKREEAVLKDTNEKPPKASTLTVDYESDEDLFGAIKSTKVGSDLKAKPAVVQSKSLFDDVDDEDDDLFKAISRKPPAAVKKSSKLFDSDDEGEKSEPVRSLKQSNHQSLFGDDSDDGDDLFSNKPKCNFHPKVNKSNLFCKFIKIKFSNNFNLFSNFRDHLNTVNNRKKPYKRSPR